MLPATKLLWVLVSPLLVAVVGWQSLVLRRLEVPFSADLLVFYRRHYSYRRLVPTLPGAASPHDCVYCLTNATDVILAAVRLTRQGSFTYLRSLCVDTLRRRQGLASDLMQQALQDFGASSIYCLADNRLSALYQRAGFYAVDESSRRFHRLPESIRERFGRMSRQWARKHKPLALFVHQSPRIIVVHHVKEVRRPSSTAWLIAACGRLEVEHWVWSGRADTDQLAANISRIADQDDDRPPTLLWTGGDVSATEQGPVRSVLVLDGTWQEASSMFRKSSVLWTLPRLSLEVGPSSYNLRKDFGYRERYTAALCTAEAVAQAVDLLTGSAVPGNRIRDGLVAFQVDYRRGGRAPML